MTKLSNEPSIHENDAESERTPSTGVMLVSILLLVAGFLLASAMLVHYGLKGKNKIGSTMPRFAKTLEMAKDTLSSAKTATKAPTPDTPQTTASKPKNSSAKGFFHGNRSVRWPRLELTGFGIPARGEIGFAIINGKHVVEGGEANGATVVEIFEHGVRVQFKGETKTLAIELTH